MKHIEAKAMELLESAGCDFIPVDLSLIAEKLNIPIHETEFTDDVSGALIREGDETVIAINTSEPLKRKRFTIAHELGHFYLKHAGTLFIDQKVFNRRDGRSELAVDRQEIEANAFAAALLMPAHRVMDAAISSLEKTPHLDQVGLATLLAAKFNVSEQAMGFRLTNLGLGY